ncbi:lipid A-modifier LpxR family protein [Ulvibacterium marinum]|uniref:lipid A-modifier LpxR family protein n=1 Tax=Ulvibacterium marinum TaxID=2419782 RepID=UPI002494DD94|nr:lipid A-modifier LpxR family protein [Ulvibacterium marinum]
MNASKSNGLFLFFILLFFSIEGNAQRPDIFSSEISLSSANDAYVIWQNSDRFYSYGAGVNLKFKKEKILRLQKYFPKKTGYFFEIGLRLEGFTPTNKTVTPSEIQQSTISFDRPYAGLLFGTFNVTYAFERYFLKGGALLGIMGPSSLAGDFQGWFHDKITDDPIFEEWRFQVPNQPIVNLNVAYAYDFIPQQKWFDVYGMLDTRLGNLYIDATPTLGFRFGKFNKLSESVGMDNNILSNSGIELFFQSAISGSLNIFDGTAQGNLFNNDFEYAVNELNTFSTTMTQSVYFSSRRFSLGIEHYFTFGKVVPNERHVYARTILKYRF